MSQRTTPKSPRSKSPSCQEDEIGESGNVSRARFDDMPDERLEDTGTRSYSRPGSVQDPRSRNASPLRPTSRLGSGYNNEEDHYQLPSPPRTLSVPGSRGASPGISQRISTRLPTPEYSRSKSRAGSPFVGSREDNGPGVSGIECDEVENAEVIERPAYIDRATSYSLRDRSIRGLSEVTGGSRGVSPGVSQQASTRIPTPEYSRSKSRAGSPFVGSREDAGMGIPGIECDEVENAEVIERPAYIDRATSYSLRDRSIRGLSEVTGGSRGVSPGVSQQASTRIPTPEYSRSKSRAGSPFVGSREDAGMGIPGIECDEGEPPEELEGPVYLSRATSYSPRDRSTRGPSEVLGGSNMNSVHFVSSRQSDESRGTQGQPTCPAPSEMSGLRSIKGRSSLAGLASGAGLPSVTASASGAGYSSTGTSLGLSCARQCPGATSGSVAPAVSGVSRKQMSSKEGSRLETTCRADCRRYLNEIEKAGPSKASLRSPVSGLSENLKQRNSQPLYSQEVRQAGPEPYVQSGGRGSTSAHTHAGHEPFMKGPQMPAASPMHHHRHDIRLQDELERDDRAMAALAHLSQLKKTPSYLMCGVNQNVDFFNVCSEEKKSKKLPERPCLQQEELAELIKCERHDVESAWYLASEERKAYKKPCPKQQKAQMNVRAIVKAHANQTCGEKYTPLEHPDPEDISPEVAASMMFSQEQGIKMDECPRNTILHLFPEEYKQPFPEKRLRNSISIVDPNEKDQDEMIEKSAAVPSEGVSDSAYTRTMKEKGDDMPAQKSFDVDFAIGQSKREYVLVAQKPRRFSRVQFRGGNLPSWFPGYFSAFPNESGIKSVSSPSGVFHKAWFHANPRNMPTNDVIVLD